MWLHVERQTGCESKFSHSDLSRVNGCCYYNQVCMQELKNLTEDNVLTRTAIFLRNKEASRELETTVRSGATLAHERPPRPLGQTALHSRSLKACLTHYAELTTLLNSRNPCSLLGVHRLSLQGEE